LGDEGVRIAWILNVGLDFRVGVQQLVEVLAGAFGEVRVGEDTRDLGLDLLHQHLAHCFEPSEILVEARPPLIESPLSRTPLAHRLLDAIRVDLHLDGVKGSDLDQPAEQRRRVVTRGETLSLLLSLTLDLAEGFAEVAKRDGEAEALLAVADRLARDDAD